MKKAILLLSILLLATTPALAQQVSEYPRVEGFVGYSYLYADLLVDHDSAHGFAGSLSGNLHRNFGLTGEITGHWGTFAGEDYQNYTFLGGPRLTGRFERATPFAHALFGFANTRAAGESDNNFAMALGGGLDVNATKEIAIRVAQLDYLFIRGSAGGLSENSHSFRVSTGVVIRWGVH
jgi:opacity protein-like surface antigen